MENDINWWFPCPYIENIEQTCSACESCANCKHNCEMCLECDSTKKLNINVEPFIPEEQMEIDFIRENPWINE